MKKCFMDERQLLQRGNIFRNMFAVMTVLLLLDSLLKEFNISPVEGTVLSGIMILIISVVFGGMQMICTDVLPIEHKGVKIYMGVFGVLSLVSVIICVYKSVAGETIVISSGRLTDDGIGLIMVSCIFLLFIVYFVKRLLNLRNTRLEMNGGE